MQVCMLFTQKLVIIYFLNGETEPKKSDFFFAIAAYGF